MILSLLTLLQVATPASAITVRTAERTYTVPVLATRSGPLVRGDLVLKPLGASLTKVGADRFAIQAGATRFDLTLQLPAVRVGNEVVPLGMAPLMIDGALYFSLAMVTDVLPRFAREFHYDAARRELERMATVSATRVPAAMRAPPPATSGPVTKPAPSTKPARAEHSVAAPVVVVDAGHGGPDRGMSGPIGAKRKIYEADITLDVARRVRDLLAKRGARVLMTRNSDTLIALPDRGRIANKAQADVFVSIHVNAANLRWPNPRGARGFETYFLSDAKTEDEKRVQDMENDAARYDVALDAEPGDPLSFLLADMVQNENLRESSRLAETVQEGLARVHPSHQDRGVKQAGFMVLVTAHMPAILVEIGFGTNATEVKYLASATGQQQLAQAIADATMSYLADYEQRKQHADPGMP